LIKIASTWEGIKAAEQLEKEVKTSPSPASLTPQPSSLSSSSSFAAEIQTLCSRTHYPRPSWHVLHDGRSNLPRFQARLYFHFTDRSMLVVGTRVDIARELGGADTGENSPSVHSFGKILSDVAYVFNL